MSEPVRRGRPEAAAAVWSWQDDGDDRRTRTAKMRRDGVIRGAVAGALGLALLYLGRPVVAYVAWGIASLALALALLSPRRGYAALDRAVRKVGQLVGVALTWLLLTPVFFLFFAPFGLLFRRGRRDPLRRELSAEAETYWTERESARSLDKPY